MEGAQVDVDNAMEIETRYFVDLVCNSRQSKNMTQAFFFDLQAINSGSLRPQGHERYTARKVGVLGAGMMGAGIAHVCARAGMQVVLKDVAVENAERGKAYTEKLNAKAVNGEHTRFLVELDYTGIFSMANVPENHVHPMMFIECPRLILPFARRVVSDATRDGGYPPLMLDNVDFATLYRQKLEQLRQEQAQQAQPN